jgi:hypothetical protein
MEFGPLGAVIREDFTLEADQNIAQATGESVFFDESPSVAEFNGRWEYLKSRGVTGVFLWERYEKYRTLVPHWQKSGTCFPAGTLVMMADGSEKPIQLIESGEYVIGHSGKPRQVLMTGSFDYRGRMATVKVARNATPTVCTQEHQFLQCVNDIVPVGARVEYEGKRNRVLYRQGENKWTSAQNLTKGDRLQVVSPEYTEDHLIVDLAKYCQEEVIRGRGAATVTLTTVRKKQTKNVLPRFLAFDSETAFITGLYAAEGTTEKHRVTFTIDARRTDLVERIQAWVSDRLPGVRVELQQKERGTAVNVRVGCTVFAEFIRDFVPGKAITKSPNVRILTTPKEIRHAFLMGWLAGDGCEFTKRKLLNTAVTSSVAMMRFFHRLSLSIGLNPSISQRKQMPHQNACAFDITWAGSEYEKLHGRDCERVPGELHEHSEFGWLTPVSEVTLSEIGEHVVYNLEVEEDHSYVVNGMAVANCVSRGFHQMIQHSYYNSLAAGVAIGDAIEIAYEPIYIGSRVYVGNSQISGEGSSGAWAGQWLSGINGEGGLCQRGVYGGADITLDNERWSVANSNRGGGIPKEMMAECQKHTCRVHRVRKNSEIADTIASRFGAARCWDTLFGDRDANGFSKPSGTGAHCQAIIGVFVMKSGKTGFVELNSWGPNMPKGQRVLKYAGGEVTLPVGCYAVTEDDYLRAQQARWWECHTASIRVGQEFR